MFSAAAIGFFWGFLGSMPIAGPVAVLVLDRGLEGRSRSALFLAMGAAIAEGVYAYLAYWGVSSLLSKHAWLIPVSRAAAALLLFGLGLRFLLKRRDHTAPVHVADQSVGNKRSFFLGLTITALNPTLIASWTALVSMTYASGLVQFVPTGALPFAIGVWCGITSWFATLLSLLRRFRSRFSGGTQDRVIRVMGVFLIAVSLLFAVLFVRSIM